MDFAVNYSVAAADLLCRGEIEIDRFKCPAWPDLIDDVQTVTPIYVHFPLRVGAGIGDAWDGEAGRPADWRKIEALLARTGTPLVNAHLSLSVRDHPDVPLDTRDPAHVDRLAACLIRDVRGMVKRLGPDRVIVENIHEFGASHLHAGLFPEVIRRVTDETGCGFLLDLSHAHIAAHDIGMDPRQYVSALPVDCIREIHISGNQRVEGRWLDLLRQAEPDEDLVRRLTGRLLDHLPMTPEDWDLTAWAMAQVHSGAWAEPWVVTMEYGGVGWFFEVVTDVDVLAAQVPRVRALVEGSALPGQDTARPGVANRG